MRANYLRLFAAACRSQALSVVATDARSSFAPRSCEAELIHGARRARLDVQAWWTAVADSKVYLGNASATPPSTGMVAPVVGVRFDARNTTAFPTCSGVTVARSRLRCR